MGCANDGLMFVLELGALAALVFAPLVVVHLALTFALGQRPALTAR
jgi:hypothetical protein